MNPTPMNTGITIGLEACIADWALPRSLRFGLLMNRASVDRQLRLSCDVLSEAYPGQIAALFTPQHGLWGDAQANMVESDHGFHSRLGVPIYSLYAESRRPTPEMLGAIDGFVIDLQDVGTRVYTFVWTMLECLKACAELSIPVWVLDRPNPIGGRIVEGPLLQDSFRSFVGGAGIPMRHGLTMGELARLLKQEFQMDVSLEVIPMGGWTAERLHPSLGRPWLYPSPNLPRVESAWVYPGQVLLEGTNLSEGRGTTTPFEVLGAPFIDAEALTNALSSMDVPGVRFLPTYFRPTFDKWCGDLCGGVSLHVTHPTDFRPFTVSVEILSTIHRLWPDQMKWLDPPYEYESEKKPIDIIYGDSKLRESLHTEVSVTELTFVDVENWSGRTADHWLYRSSGSASSGFHRFMT